MPNITAQFRYEGMVFTLQICFSAETYAAIMQHFPDGVIDWNTVQTLPHVHSTPAQRAEIAALLARRYAHATMQPVWPARL